MPDDYGNTSVMDVMFREMQGDDSDESEKLIDFYQAVNEREKAVINRVLIYACGWSLPTLIRRAADPEAKDEVGDVPPYAHSP